MDGNHEVPSEVQLSGVLDLFERLRDRPPSWRWRERPRPLLFLLGPGRSTFRTVETLDKRSAGERAPISRIAAKTGKRDVADVLREAKRELSRRRCHPRLEPALRFPLLEMALWLRNLRRFHLQNLAREEQERREGPVVPGTNGHGPVEEDLSSEEQEDHRLVRDLASADRDETRRGKLAQRVRRRGRSLPRDLEDVDRGRLAAFLTYLEQVAPIGVVIVTLISATVGNALDLAAAGVALGFGLSAIAGQILARSRGWFAVRRYGWFGHQPYMRRATVNDFLDTALEMILPSKADGREQHEQLDRLLVAAFLEDLRCNYRRDFRRAAWARVRYPALIFDHLTAGHIGVRFIEIVEQVRARAQTERGLSDFDPLVIVAGIDPASPAATTEPADARGATLVDQLGRSIAMETAGDSSASLDEAVSLWTRHTQEQRRLGALGFRRELRVDLTRIHDVDPDEINGGRRRPWAAHPAIPLVTMVGVVIATGAWAWHKHAEGCDPPTVDRTVNDECVGLTDGAYSFDPRLNGVERLIKQQNDNVLASGKPYITIVYLGPLTPDPGTKNPEQDLLASAQGELVGVLIEQQRENESGLPLRLRVLLANAGSKMRYAKQAAEQIRMRALHDPHIVGVVGFEQSRTQTQQAIAEISRAAIPMIGTANSYDDTAKQANGQFSHYYFRLAPPNTRLAEHAAHWARSGITGVHARTATVFYDGDREDLYSKNLADDFASAFVNRFGGDHVRELSYTDPSQVPGLVEQACADRSDLFYYAARSDEFRAFIKKIDEIDCGNGKRRVVLADDEIAKYVNDNAPEIGDDEAIKLFYTPLALREAWVSKWVGSQRRADFFQRYDDVVERTAGKNASSAKLPSPTHAAVSYDAVLMFATVAEQIYGDQQQHAQPTTAAVLAAMLEPEGGPSLQGASGVLRFGPRIGGHQVEDKPMLLATVLPGGRQDVLAICGQLVPSGAQRDCLPGDH